MLTRFAPPVVFVLFLAATAGAGYVQGQLTNRWGVRPDSRRAFEQLEVALPKECGSWRLKEELKMTPEVLRILENPAYLQGQYVHEQTGDVATVFVIVGHPGPVSVHTPEVCYSSREYETSGARRKTTIELPSKAIHQLWELHLKARNELAGSPLRVFYAWSTGTMWEAAEHPRFSYGGMPHLYKLQVAINLQGSSTKDFDPAKDFLTSFLADLQPRLVEGSRRSGSSS